MATQRFMATLRVGQGDQADKKAPADHTGRPGGWSANQGDQERAQEADKRGAPQSTATRQINIFL